MATGEIASRASGALGGKRSTREGSDGTSFEWAVLDDAFA
jgi:hypothetical protein